MNVLERAIKNFWDKQAQENGAGQQATNEDTWYRSLEIREIIKELGRFGGPGFVLDVGCGNGFSTCKFAQAYPSALFEGIDFSEPMIVQANQTNQYNTNFYVGNVLHIRGCKYKYNTIVSERCLINLIGYEQPEQAVLQLKNIMTRYGRLILVENTLDGRVRLNKMRKWLGLPAIGVRWHNRYLDHEPFLAFLKEHFEHVECRNIGTPYYLLSRVIYAKYAAMRGVEPDYNNWMNRFACKLPVISGWWASPNMMYVCAGKKS